MHSLKPHGADEVGDDRVAGDVAGGGAGHKEPTGGRVGGVVGGGAQDLGVDAHLEEF